MGYGHIPLASVALCLTSLVRFRSTVPWQRRSPIRAIIGHLTRDIDLLGELALYIINTRGEILLAYQVLYAKQFAIGETKLQRTTYSSLGRRAAAVPMIVASSPY